MFLFRAGVSRSGGGSGGGGGATPPRVTSVSKNKLWLLIGYINSAKQYYLCKQKADIYILDSDLVWWNQLTIISADICVVWGESFLIVKVKFIVSNLGLICICLSEIFRTNIEPWFLLTCCEIYLDYFVVKNRY